MQKYDYLYTQLLLSEKAPKTMVWKNEWTLTPIFVGYDIIYRISKDDLDVVDIRVFDKNKVKLDFFYANRDQIGIEKMIKYLDMNCEKRLWFDKYTWQCRNKEAASAVEHLVAHALDYFEK